MRLGYRGYSCTEVAGICDISVQMVYQLRRDVRRNTDRARAARWKALAAKLKRERDALRRQVRLESAPSVLAIFGH
jgi:hypothetical protein